MAVRRPGMSAREVRRGRGRDKGWDWDLEWEGVGFESENLFGVGWCLGGF
jgi:hypothetical protein